MTGKTTLLNLYRIKGTASGWDTYDGAIVAAPDEATARRIHPEDGSMHGDPKSATRINGWDEQLDGYKGGVIKWGRTYVSWAESPADVTVEHVGVAAEGVEQGVILSSFRAG